MSGIYAWREPEQINTRAVRRSVFGEGSSVPSIAEGSKSYCEESINGGIAFHLLRHGDVQPGFG